MLDVDDDAGVARRAVHKLLGAVQRVGEPAAALHLLGDIVEALVFFADDPLVRKVTRNNLTHGLLSLEVDPRRVVRPLAVVDGAVKLLASVLAVDGPAGARCFLGDPTPKLEVVAKPHSPLRATS